MAWCSNSHFLRTRWATRESSPVAIGSRSVKISTVQRQRYFAAQRNDLNVSLSLGCIFLGSLGRSGCAHAIRKIPVRTCVTACRLNRPAHEFEEHGTLTLAAIGELFVSNQPDFVWWPMAQVHDFIHPADANVFSGSVEHSMVLDVIRRLGQRSVTPVTAPKYAGGAGDCTVGGQKPPPEPPAPSSDPGQEVGPRLDRNCHNTAPRDSGDRMQGHARTPRTRGSV